MASASQAIPQVSLSGTALHALQNGGRFWHRDREFRPTYRGPTHALHLYEYACTMRWCGLEVDLEPGDLSVSPALEGSTYHLPRDGRHWCIHFHPLPANDPVMRVPVYLRLGRHADAVKERFAHISHLIGRSRSADQASVYHRCAAQAAFQELLLQLALLGLGEGGPRPRAEAAAERAAEVLSTRFAEVVSMPSLCAEVGVSQNHLAATFRRRFGMTMPRFLLSRRIERATLLLATTDSPVQAISAAVGLPDPRHFAKQFRRVTGMTPSQARG